MRRKGPFVRDVELHGHNRMCPKYHPEEEEMAGLPCCCVECDHDDWIAQGESEMDRRREEPRERMEEDD